MMRWEVHGQCWNWRQIADDAHAREGKRREGGRWGGGRGEGEGRRRDDIRECRRACASLGSDDCVAARESAMMTWAVSVGSCGERGRERLMPLPLELT